jgi:hypothetical protein
MATNDNVRFSIKVPLGDTEHPKEEKGSTKYVKRTLANLKGSKPKRTGIVFWRKGHHVAEENPENPGSFAVTRKAKASEAPENASPKKKSTPAKEVTVSKTAKKGAAKKSARAKKGAAKKESDKRKAA